MTTALVIFISSAEYARKETAAGSLITTDGVVRVSAGREGVVTGLRVKEGDQVAAGQPLFTIGVRNGLEGGGSLHANLIQSIDAQIQLIKEQIAVDPARVANETVRLAAAIQSVRAQREAIAAQRRLQAERVDGAEERRQTLLQLYQKGSGTKVALQDQEGILLAHRQSVAELDRQMASVERDLEQAQLQKEQLPVQQSERLSQLRLGLADRERQRVEVEAQRAQVVRAPIGGRVTALQIGDGQIVDANRPLLTVIPDGHELQAELFVPSRAIGFVEPGQRVRLMIDAFPYQRFGAYSGTVDAVSQAILAPSEVFGRVPLKEPTYRVIVRLDRQTIDAFGRQVALQPDMTVQADIVLQARSLVAWLFEPLLSVRGRL
ncbi:HlyD family secretion protein [Microvirga alba]|uniref:HlyD family secretion protein n=1 Tax=Microvirga alba TaxID=2791025 RepID=UPI002D21CF44|nr:HlyD family efflux transporter periplasmic adaptor subunit [Microvirga alba]